MTSGSRRWVALAAAALALAGAAIALTTRAGQGDSSPKQRPVVLVLTGLPILFGESFSLDEAPSPVLTRLERDYDVRPIGAAEPASLEGQRLLLMAQPRAQPAELLVALDQWVGDGGHLLLLADPRLDWPSEKPLGDLTRPPPMFADTGLLRHWGLELLAPEAEGRSSIDVEGTAVRTNSAGSLRLLSGSMCRTVSDGFLARCTIGRGRVTIVADADFLHSGEDETGGHAASNLDFLDRELRRLAAIN